MSVETLSKVEEIALKWDKKPDNIIEMMHDVQSEFNYLPKDVIVELSNVSKVPVSNIYSIATFYNAFSLKPKGKHKICVCGGTPCYTLGAARITEALERELKIKCGETTPDKKFSLEMTRCLSACGLAPVVVISDDLYGPTTVPGISKLLKKYEKK
jgi:NADH:ubiquinone oxidoreductase subunit E